MTDTATTENGKATARDREYVVGGGYWWYRGQQSRALALPWAIDDLTQDFGPDLYERMLDDSQVAACDILMRAAILEDGVTLSPAVDEVGADGYDQAVELVAFCNPVLEDLETALDDVLWDMLGSMALGNRVAEITYHPFDRSPLPGRAVLRSLTVKPRESLAFVVDSAMRTIGFLGRQQGGPMVATGQLVDVATDTRFIERQKFMVATCRPVNNDPRGSSDLRPAYWPWWLKQQTWQEFLKYLAQFASAIVVGTTAPGARDEIDPATGQTLTAPQALLKQLIALANGSAIAVPHDTLIDLLFSQGEGQAFINAFALYDAQIRMAITTQTLATGEGEYASRAQAGVHQDALDTLLRQAKRAICRMLRRDVLRNLVRYNYGDKLASLTPLVSLGDVQAEDAAKLITAFALAGWTLHPSQLTAVDRRVNVPPRVLTDEPAPAPEDGQQQGGQDPLVEEDGNG